MVDFIEISGWIGSLSYALYSVPQAINVYRKGHTEGMSTTMLALIFFGALLSLIYLLPDFTSPLFYNFLLTLSMAIVMLKYHFFPRK